MQLINPIWIVIHFVPSGKGTSIGVPLHVIGVFFFIAKHIFFDMNVIFCLVTLSAGLIMLFSTPEQFVKTMSDGAMQGITFSIKLLAIYTVWLSLMKIWEKLKLDTLLSKKMQPLLTKIFPNEQAECYDNLSVNLSANILGMGGAATPAGIKATELMKNNKNRIMLLVINSTSIQLIPTTIISMRSSYSATSDIILPTLISTVISTIIGVILVKIFVK